MSSFPRVGDDFAGYRIESVLGRGGMGVVFRARQLRLNRVVALKVLSPELIDTDEFRARFVREATTLAAIDSPHVIQVYDHGEEDGCLYIVTQLVRGPDLSTAILEGGPRPPADAIGLAAQVASALAVAHDAGLVHRDVKPSNILIRQEDTGVHAYLCDFGVARATQATTTLTRTGSLIGTFGYLAPECCEGAGATVVSDIYALGCVLVTMVTGTAPYQGTDFHVMKQHVEAAVPRWPGTSALDRSIDSIIQRSMAKRPEDRFSSAREMRDALMAALEKPMADTIVRVPSRTPTVVRNTRFDTRVPSRLPMKRGWAVPAAAAAILCLLGGSAYALAHRSGSRHGSTSSVSDGSSKATASSRASSKPASTQPTRTSTPSTQAATPPKPAGISSPGVGGSSIPQHRCWNDTFANDAASCSRPTGVSGLRYVFPSFDAEYRVGRCQFRANEIGQPAFRGITQSWRCSVSVGSGQTAWLNYAEWSSKSLNLAHYRSKYRQSGAPDDYFLSFGPAAVGGTKGAHQTSRAFVSGKLPFSATAIAFDDADLHQAITQLAARAPDEVNQ